jgi:hypothetical protein
VRHRSPPPSTVTDQNHPISGRRTVTETISAAAWSSDNTIVGRWKSLAWPVEDAMTAPIAMPNSPFRACRIGSLRDSRQPAMPSPTSTERINAGAAPRRC